MTKAVSLTLVLIFLVAAAVFIVKNSKSTTSNSAIKIAAAEIGTRTKTSDCHISGAFQDKNCSPGKAIVGVTKDEVCTSGYAKKVRNVPQSEKNAVYAEYGITSHTTGQYEVDHIVSLELGGSNDIDNLYPEAAEPKPGFHEKDTIENYLHNEVCTDKISLEDAQKVIANDWLGLYQQLHP